MVASWERSQRPRYKTEPCTQVCSCLASHLRGPIQGKLRRLRLLADLVEGLRAPCQAWRTEGARGRGPQWKFLPVAGLVPPTLPTPSAHPRNAPPAPHIPFLSFLPGAETVRSWPGSPGRNLQGGRPGIGLRGRLTRRPRCLASVQGSTGNARPAPAPELAMDPETQGCSPIGGQIEACPGRGPWATCHPPSPFVYFRARLVPGASPLSLPSNPGLPLREHCGAQDEWASWTPSGRGTLCSPVLGAD